jgi:hypothetical protein
MIDPNCCRNKLSVAAMLNFRVDSTPNHLSLSLKKALSNHWSYYLSLDLRLWRPCPDQAKVTFGLTPVYQIIKRFVQLTVIILHHSL